jgi:hypothetical protein
MKKKLAVLLSAFLAVYSVLPINAAAATSNNTLKITGTCSIPTVTIDVVVPSSEKVYLNPSKVSVKLGATISDAQIVTEVGYIENRSEVPLSVSATVNAAIKSGSTMKLVTASTKNSTSKAKQAFVFFQMQKASEQTISNNISWDQTYDADKHILVTTSSKSKTNFITLDQYDPENDTTDRYGAFMLSGDCIVMPTSGWTTKDGFTATIAFTFKAMPLSS